MARDDVTLDIGIDTGDAIKGLSKFQRQSTKSLESISKSFGALKIAAGAVVGVLAGRAIVNGLGAVTEAAAIQEEAVQKLNTALKLSGDFSKAASDDLQDFASALQQTSTVGDEAVLEQLALAKSFGTTNEQAKELVAAAVDLSAATGISLDSAVKNLGKTLGGLTGELGESVPALRELTAEQLKAGEAIDFVTQRFGGAAQALTQTFSGATQQASNSFGDFQEVLGSFITENPLVIKAINLFSSSITRLGAFIAANRESIQGFLVSAFASLADALPGIIRTLGVFAKALGFLVSILASVSGLIRDTTLAVFDLALSFEPVKTAINGVADVFRFLISEFASGLSTIFRVVSGLPGIGDRFKQFQIDLDAISEGLEDFSDSVVATGGQDVVGPLRKGIEAARETNEAFTKNAVAGVATVVGGFDAAANSVEGLGDSIRDLSKGGGVEVPVDLDVKASESIFTPIVEAFEKNAPKIAESLSTALSRGAGGADQLLTAGVEAAADAFAPGFGKAAGQLFAVLAQGPEKVRELVDSLIQRIPQVIDSVIASIPVLVETLVANLDTLIGSLLDSVVNAVLLLIENVPQIVQAIVEEVPQIITAIVQRIPVIIDKLAEQLPEIIPPAVVALANAMPSVANALAAQSPRIAISLAKNMPLVAVEFAKQMPTAAKEFGNSLVSEGKRFVDAIVRGFNDAVNISGAGGGGGGGGVLGKIGGGLGFAEGGTVPPGFPNDSFPANLTSGELVVPKSDVDRLSSFLDRQEAFMAAQQGGSEQNLTVNLVVSEQELANVSLNLGRQGFRTG